MESATVAVDKYAFEEHILQGRHISYEELESENQALEFSTLGNRMLKNMKIQSLTNDLFITLELMKAGKYNNAAALLSDEPIAMNSTIHLIALKGNSVIEIKDRKSLINMSVLKQYEQCLTFFDKHLNVGEVIEGTYRRTVEEVPLVAYREAVTNLIIHRDYTKKGEARIEIYDNRIEILSPGSLPIGLS